MGALQITDLDDFLTPSQACIIPVRSSQPAAPGGSDKTEIQIDDQNNYYEVSTYPTSSDPAGPSGIEVAGRQALKKAEISLNDCLACSGCITSTESLLITMQSHNEVLDFIRAFTTTTSTTTTSHRTPVLSISPQSLASLSASYSAAYSRPPIPLLTLLRRIRAFLAKSENGSWFTWDTTFARHVSLRESVDEFFARQANAKSGASATMAKVRSASSIASSGAGGEKGDLGPLPVLASACPGWVCYAEKAQGDLLPFLSAARSSQGVMGALVKSWWGGQTGRTPDDIYHVTAMPCYDKKLEASRPDFNAGNGSKSRETDCVVTTGELDLLLSELGFEPFAEVLEEGEGSASSTESDRMEVDGDRKSALEDRHGAPWPELMEHKGSSSGSYLATIIDAVSTSHGSPTSLTTRAIRGSDDNVEYILTDASSGQVLFKGVRCYGFRNLQNLVRRVNKETGLGGRGGAGRLSAAVAARRKKNRLAGGAGVGAVGGRGGSETPTTAEGSDAEREKEEKKLDYVEVMACPGGCVNGGGQMKPAAAVAAVSSGGVVGGASSAVAAEVGVASGVEGVEGAVANKAVIQGQGMVGVTGIDEGMRWSTKEWVSKVEDIYWTGLPTPPASPRAADVLAEEVGKELKEGGKLGAVFKKVDGDVMEKGLTHEQVVW